MNYNYIINPITNRKVSIYNKIGKEVLKGYIVYLKNQRGGGELCDINCLHNIFGDFKKPSDTTVDLNDTRDQKYVKNTYGTLTPEGVNKLIKYLSIDKNDIFTDLGSGIGNIVMNFAANTDVKLSRGIEFLKSRHYAGLNYLKKFEEEMGGKVNTKIELINGDIYDYDYSDSTIVFACSTCFPNELMDNIVKKCEQNKNLKYFITQKILEDNINLDHIGNVVLKASWNSKCVFKIYKNKFQNSKLLLVN